MIRDVSDMWQRPSNGWSLSSLHLPFCPPTAAAPSPHLTLTLVSSCLLSSPLKSLKCPQESVITPASRPGYPIFASPRCLRKRYGSNSCPGLFSRLPNFWFPEPNVQYLGHMRHIKRQWHSSPQTLNLYGIAATCTRY